MQQVLVSGSAGFIGGYVVEELLERGYAVVGLDNFSKYGKVRKSYDEHPRYRLVEGDARDVALMTELLADCDQFIAGAAMIGGISYFHTYAYDLLADQRADHRVVLRRGDRRAQGRPAAQGHLPVLLDGLRERRRVALLRGAAAARSRRPCPPTASRSWRWSTSPGPRWDQYGCPYTLVRPFNCVGIGESRALGDTEILSGNVQLAMSHVVPDLVQKVLKGQDPLHILGSGDQVRHYTYGGDLAAGVVTAMEHPDALNEDFNLSTAQSTTVRQLAELIWRKIKGAGVPLTLVARRAVRVRRPAPRSRYREGQAGPRLRGDHDAGSDARRGHPLDRRGDQGWNHLSWSTDGRRVTVAQGLSRSGAASRPGHRRRRPGRGRTNTWPKAAALVGLGDPVRAAVRPALRPQRVPFHHPPVRAG